MVAILFELLSSEILFVDAKKEEIEKIIFIHVLQNINLKNIFE